MSKPTKPAARSKTAKTQAGTAPRKKAPAKPDPTLAEAMEERALDFRMVQQQQE